MKKSFLRNNNFCAFIILFSVFLLLAGCHDIFEDNIEGKKVVLTSPKDAFQTNNPRVILTWEDLDGAAYYNLKVVAPSFNPDSITKIVLDTNITVNSFVVVLDSGKYQWGVKAMNSVSSTILSYRNLSIVGVIIPVVTPKNPSDKMASNDTTVSFSWDGKDNLQFHFYLYFNEALIYDTLTAVKSLKLPTNASNKFTLDQGNYKWQIMAINAKGTESALETRTFIMDRTAPVKPTLLSPRNDSLFSKTPVTLSWKQHTDSGAPLFDSVFIATDSLFRNMPDVEKVASSGNYDFKPTSNTTYYWRVRTFDNAGNSSSYSNWLKFRYNAK